MNEKLFMFIFLY